MHQLKRFLLKRLFLEGWNFYWLNNFYPSDKRLEKYLMHQFKYIFRNAVTNATLALSRMILNSLIDENCESLSQIIEVTSVFHENKVIFNV